MKTLVLMRHAKSAWTSDNVPDHDRPLAPRGRESAPRMATWLSKKKLTPQLVLCSTARRVKETYDLVRAALGTEPPVRESRRLYMALPREILAEIGKSPDDIKTLMVIGHNPGMGSLAHWLAGQGDRQELARLAEKFPTAAVAVLDFDVERWAEIDADGGTLRHFVTPKGGD